MENESIKEKTIDKWNRFNTKKDETLPPVKIEGKTEKETSEPDAVTVDVRVKNILKESFDELAENFGKRVLEILNEEPDVKEKETKKKEKKGMFSQ